MINLGPITVGVGPPRLSPHDRSMTALKTKIPKASTGRSWCQFGPIPWFVGHPV